LDEKALAIKFMAITFLGSELNPFSKSNRAVINIIILCTAVWVFTALLSIIPLSRPLVQWLMFTPNPSSFIYQPWSIVTYIFLHNGFIHLLFNMLWLFFVGSILEDLAGRKHIWRTFLWGGITGGAAFMLLYVLFFQQDGSTHYMVGASGGVTAVIFATAAFVPHYRVFLFGILQIELMWIAVFLLIFDIIGMAGPFNQGGYIAHIGGAIFGVIYMLHIKGTIHIPIVDELNNWGRGFFKSNKKTRPLRTAKVSIQKPIKGKSEPTPSQADIDAILDKINLSGYDSLSKAEKEKLFRAGDQ
jgi:membrane associated rhomboid family serine protease